MKNLLYWLSITFFIAACMSSEKNRTIPFEMMPGGLKKKIKQEVFSEMEKDVIKNMERLHIQYSDPYYMPPCYRSCAPIIIERNLDSNIILFGISNNLSHIAQEVFFYYTGNEALSEKEANQKVRDPNYTYYEYPFYNRISLSTINDKIEENEVLLSQALAINDENLVSFYEKCLQEWYYKHESSLVLDTDTLLEIDADALVTIKDHLNKKGISPLTREAIEGMIQVREFATQKYFKTSYFDLYFQSTRRNDTLATRRLNTIDRLYKINIIDKTYAERNNLKISYDIEEPEEIVP